MNFFYAATGSGIRLGKMEQVAKSLADPILKFNTAIFTGNIVEKVSVLAETGQIPLAYLTAKSHGLTEQADTLEKTLIESEEYDHEKIIA